MKGTALALCLGTAALAQQDPQFTQYMFNLMAINPAYAGSAERVSIRALSRHQWVGFEGAPTTQTLSIHSPLPFESLCVGGLVLRDELGPVRQYTIMGDVAYRLFLGNDAKLAFGLQGGVNIFRGDYTSLSPLEPNDQVFMENVESKVDPQFGFGTMYYADRFYVGLSTPKIMRTKFYENAELDTIGSPFEEGQKAHWFLTGGYVFDLSTYTKFKPTAMLKAVDGAPLSFDLSASFLFYEKFWLGAMYRHEDAVGAYVQYWFTDGLHAGYAYDLPLSPLRDYSGGSHEIMIGYDFGNKVKGVRSPRYF
jgi:type IX secretion system PorP/SprF family membrane protein